MDPFFNASWERKNCFTVETQNKKKIYCNMQGQHHHTGFFFKFYAYIV